MNENYKYDDWGNITYKQNTGYYKYDTNKTNRLLGVYQYSNFTGQQAYNLSYDNNGNVKNDGKRKSDYTNFDKPYLITQGTSKTAFSYGPNREVYKRVDTRGGKQTKTLYLGGYEQVKLPSGVIEHKFYVGNVVITERSNNANDEFYLHKDHQGSTTSITNASGMVVQQFIYDPWGKQYNVHSNSIFSAYSSPGISRGYTGHKMVNDMDIIHMNGRTYNVALGRFMQADPHIQAPMNSQNYNRYSYVLNNPMSMTDPSGYFFNKLFKKLNKAFGNFAPFVGMAMMFVPGAQSYGVAMLKGFIAGGIATGSLKGAVIGAFSAAAFTGIGQHFKGLAAANGAGSVTRKFGGNMLTSGQIAGQIASHAFTGGVISTLSGGKFGHGFFAAGVTKGLGGAFLHGGENLTTGEIIGGTLVSAVIGGTASKISGGKFANGANTGAFQYLFNQAGTALKKAYNYAMHDVANIDTSTFEGRTKLAAYMVLSGQAADLDTAFNKINRGDMASFQAHAKLNIALANLNHANAVKEFTSFVEGNIEQAKGYGLAVNISAAASGSLRLIGASYVLDYKTMIDAASLADHIISPNGITQAVSNGQSYLKSKYGGNL
jgi:RHS repeat-associated protein